MKVSGDQRVEGCTDLVTLDTEIQLGSLTCSVQQTPCHTTGSVCYHFPQLNSVFTGDTIFYGGVGRFFEGTPDQMVSSVKKIQALPGETQIFPGHEYTVSNLKFSAYFEPENEKTKLLLAECSEKRSNDKFTVPSTVDTENSINPFFRFANDFMIKKTGGSDETEVMKLIREAKNGYRPS